MLNIIVYYPCSYPMHVNESTVCESWPKKMKDKIIRDSNSFFSEESLSVAFIPVIATYHPALVIIYCDKRTGLALNLPDGSFERSIDKALLSLGDNANKKFSMHVIISDSAHTFQVDGVTIL